MSTTETITASDIRARLAATRPNTIFSAVFIKRDGTKRTMVCRLGVRKDLTGVGLSYEPADHNNLIVFDMAKGAYRTIPFDRLLSITISGQTWVRAED